MSDRRRLLSEADFEQIRRRYPDELTADIARDLGRTIASINRAAAKLGLRKSKTLVAQMARERTLGPGHGSHKARFQKGNVPANKGTKRPGFAPGRMATTQFKPGQKPHTTLPIGSYRICDGQLQQKTSDAKGPNNKRWTPVTRLVWAKANGPVPDGFRVAFKPGQATNILDEITIDRLELVTPAEIMRRNTIHRLPQELKQVVQLKGRIRSIITKREKKRDQENQHY
jgi:transposase-like protein